MTVTKDFKIEEVTPAIQTGQIRAIGLVLEAYADTFSVAFIGQMLTNMPILLILP